jgi:hypothetical protein
VPDSQFISYFHTPEKAAFVPSPGPLTSHRQTRFVLRTSRKRTSQKPPSPPLRCEQVLFGCPSAGLDPSITRFSPPGFFPIQQFLLSCPLAWSLLTGNGSARLAVKMGPSGSYNNSEHRVSARQDTGRARPWLNEIQRAKVACVTRSFRRRPVQVCPEHDVLDVVRHIHKPYSQAGRVEIRFDSNPGLVDFLAISSGIFSYLMRPAWLPAGLRQG